MILPLNPWQHSIEEKNPIPLSIYYIPICITFAFFNNGQKLVLDPCLAEEQVSEGSLTFVINIHGELCTLSKAGGVPITREQVLQCAQIASVKVQAVTNLIKDAIKETENSAR